MPNWRRALFSDFWFIRVQNMNFEEMLKILNEIYLKKRNLMFLNMDFGGLKVS